jgi:hypothetical protein
MVIYRLAPRQTGIEAGPTRFEQNRLSPLE